MADLHQFEEKIDLFLRGEMTSAETEAFQQQLDSDPLLKSEFDLNNSMVEGIKQYRMAELKARLSAITISPFPVNFWAGIGSAAIIGGITATLIYQVATSDEIEAVQENPAQVETVEEMPSKDSDNSIELKTDEQENTPATSNSPSKYNSVTIVEAPSKGSTNPSSQVKELVTEKKQNEPIVSATLPKGPNESSKIERSTKTDQTGGKAFETSDQKLDVDVKQHPEYPFHFQYSDHKLFIYGSLDKEPYRLLELKQNGVNNLYLAYDGKYYFLEDHTINPEPLKPIKDKNLLKNLRELDSRN